MAGINNDIPKELTDFLRGKGIVFTNELGKVIRNLPPNAQGRIYEIILGAKKIEESYFRDTSDPLHGESSGMIYGEGGFGMANCVGDRIYSVYPGGSPALSFPNPDGQIGRG